MSNNWTANMAERDAAIQAGRDAYKASSDRIPSRFDAQGLREWFLRGYDIAACKAARAAKRSSPI